MRILDNGLRVCAAFLRHDAFRASPVKTLSRAGLWLALTALKREATVTFTELGGAQVTLPPRLRHGGATSPYVFRDHYDLELRWMAGYLRPGMVVVDGGANIGVYAMVAAAQVGDGGRVFAFEPGAWSFSYLERNAARTKNVFVYKAALSDRSGEQPLFHVNNAPNSYALAPEVGVDSETVKVTTIDETLSDMKLDFLKLDVEGAEELALRGASVALAHRPAVLFEMNLSRARALGCDPAGAWQILSELGYRLYRLRRGSLEAVGGGPRDEANYIALCPGAADIGR